MDTLIPAFLRRQRNQRRLTLEMLSAKVGMSPQHLSEIESGKRDPRLSSIERMAEAMGPNITSLKLALQRVLVASTSSIADRYLQITICSSNSRSTFSRPRSPMASRSACDRDTISSILSAKSDASLGLHK
jgi:transcriptional regulator with XRE-family HTH domain